MCKIFLLSSGLLWRKMNFCKNVAQGFSSIFGFRACFRSIIGEQFRLWWRQLVENFMPNPGICVAFDLLAYTRRKVAPSGIWSKNRKIGDFGTSNRHISGMAERKLKIRKDSWSARKTVLDSIKIPTSAKTKMEGRRSNLRGNDS